MEGWKVDAMSTKCEAAFTYSKTETSVKGGGGGVGHILVKGWVHVL